MLVVVAIVFAWRADQRVLDLESRLAEKDRLIDVLKAEIDALAEVIARISEFADDQRDRISELDVNPLICAGERVIAVDALIAKPTSKP